MHSAQMAEQQESATDAIMSILKREAEEEEEEEGEAGAGGKGPRRRRRDAIPFDVHVVVRELRIALTYLNGSLTGQSRNRLQR